jgi:hypothetical protein
MNSSASIVMSDLLVCGLLGLVGQAVRAVGGLKKMNDEAAQQAVSAADLFVASRLLVSLMIGFIAGILAGLSLGLNNVFGDNVPAMATLLGIASAGYAGTDFIEAMAPTITGQLSKSTTTVADLKANIPGVSGATVNPKYGVTFGSLVQDGFFSANPDDMSVRRSIRTNNPGALNFSAWQRSRAGYVAVTQPDDSSGHNVTTIYRTPEHGAAAWYHLLAVLYAFPGGTFTLQALAARYAGSEAPPATIQGYVNGWTRWYTMPISATTTISVADDTAMLALAKAMFSHEAGVPTPVKDAQITFAIQRERAGTLPA